jgi:hypothetical protein
MTWVDLVLITQTYDLHVDKHRIRLQQGEVNRETRQDRRLGH